MRILVIEDERTLAGFVEQSLRSEGYAVTVRHDGPSGEAAALTGDYALVLRDLTLPGKDGSRGAASDPAPAPGPAGGRADRTGRDRATSGRARPRRQ